LDIVSRISDLSLPPFLIAEMSGNHGGELNKALKLVAAAKEAGADAIKLQTYRPDTITVEGKDERFLLKSGLWSGRYLHDLYQDAMTPWEWHKEISEEANKLGLVCFSSPFDESAVDFLEATINPSIYKIASFEMNHFPMLKKIGSTGKPVLASVGVCQDRDIERAMEVLKKSGCPEIILLHCVSEYPADPKDFCLQNMPLLREKYGTLFGLSDHSLGHLVAVASTALGARVIEKHLCLDRENKSVDGGFSMLPCEFSELVEAVHTTHSAISGSEIPQKPAFFKRSILVSSPIQAGERFTPQNIRVARPGDGLCPSRWTEIMDAHATKDMSVGHPITDEDFTFE
jgi:pseudaminic acid synthase